MTRQRVIFSLGIYLFCATISAEAQEIYPNKDTVEIVALDRVLVSASASKKYYIANLSDSQRIGKDVLRAAQNVQIINQSLLKDQQALNVNESITRNVSGTFREELHNGISSDIYSRGGYINAQRNGVDLRPLLKGPLGDDISIIENIEFMKGPSAFMNALGDPAGSYNIVTKKPTGNKRSSYTMHQGSFGLFRGEADIEGTYDQSNKVYYRLNLMGMHKKGFMKFDDNSRILIAPSITYNFDKNTSLTAEYIYQNLTYLMLSEAQISPYGFGTLPIDFTITDPSTRPYRANEHSAFLNFKKVFNPNWNMNFQVANINSSSVGSMYWVYGKNSNDPDTLDRYFVYDAMKYNTFSVQAFVRGQFSTGAVKHTFVGGVDYNNKTNKTQDTWNTATTVYPLSIKNPVYSNVINNQGIGGDFESENVIDGESNLTAGHLYYISPYISDDLAFFSDRLRLNAGLRMTYAKSDFNQYGDQTASENFVLSPRVGVNYMYRPRATIYGLFDNTFLPLSGKTFDGQELKPIKGQSLEFGLKNEWSESFSSTVSVYSIRRSNTVVNDPVNNDLYQTGENKAQGVEVDLRGRLVQGLNVILNYAYTDSKITKDNQNPQMVGKATPNRIKHIQNTWLSYTFPWRVLEDFSVGVGYQYMGGRSERFTAIEPAPMKDMFRMDSGISYAKNKVAVNFMVNNILNSHQYSTAWKRNDMYYWVQLAPINYRISLTLSL